LLDYSLENKKRMEILGDMYKLGERVELLRYIYKLGWMSKKESPEEVYTKRFRLGCIAPWSEEKFGTLVGIFEYWGISECSMRLRGRPLVCYVRSMLFGNMLSENSTGPFLE
jgi:hypothetical protein